MADSSTEAIPSVMSPSPGITWPASTTTWSPFRSEEALTSSSRPPESFRADTSRRILRRDSAWAFPRPSATASARLAKTTVNQSHKLTESVNQPGAACGGWAMRSRSQSSVVRTLPTSTTNITGFLATSRGSSFRRLERAACRRRAGSRSERVFD